MTLLYEKHLVQLLLLLRCVLHPYHSCIFFYHRLERFLQLRDELPNFFHTKNLPFSLDDLQFFCFCSSIVEQYLDSLDHCMLVHDVFCLIPLTIQDEQIREEEVFHIFHTQTVYLAASHSFLVVVFLVVPLFPTIYVLLPPFYALDLVVGLR